MDLKKRISKIRLLIIDVDGTLTDGTLFILPNGEEAKGFNVKDGTGIVMARLAGIEIAIITGKFSESIRKRIETLGIKEYHQGISNKLLIFNKLLKKYSLKKENCCYIGDDIGDIPPMKQSGFAASPSDSHEKVKEISHFITESPGGKGAVREVIDLILNTQNKMDYAVKKFNKLNERNKHKTLPSS